MKLSKSKKVLAAVAIATSLSGAALLVTPTNFTGGTVAYAATTSLNFTLADIAIARYNALVEADYTATSWQAFHQVAPSAEVQKMASMIATMKTQTDAEIEENGTKLADVQKELFGFADTVNVGITQILVKKSELYTLNFSAIKAAIARYNALKPADYTPESWAALQASFVYDDGTPFTIAEYTKGLSELEALTPDELVYLLRMTFLTAADVQNELDHNAAAINERIDLLVAASPAQPTTPITKNTGLPTTSSAPKGAVAKTNATKESSVAPLALLGASALAILGSATYKIRKEN